MLSSIEKRGKFPSPEGKYAQHDQIPLSGAPPSNCYKEEKRVSTGIWRKGRHSQLLRNPGLNQLEGVLSGQEN